MMDTPQGSAIRGVKNLKKSVSLPAGLIELDRTADGVSEAPKMDHLNVILYFPSVYIPIGDGCPKCGPGVNYGPQTDLKRPVITISDWYVLQFALHK